MADDRLPRDDEDFHAFIRRLHPKPKDQMTRAEHADWYCDCADWIGYFAFRGAAKVVQPGTATAGKVEGNEIRPHGDDRIG